MWFKKELDFDEEKGDNDFDAGDDETSLSHDIKVEFEDTKEDLTSRSKLLFHFIFHGLYQVGYHRAVY